MGVIVGIFIGEFTTSVPMRLVAGAVSGTMKAMVKLPSD